MSGKQKHGFLSTDLAREFVACTALLIFISAVWVESDAYRYVAVATLIPTTIYYFRKNFRSDDEVLSGGMGLLCLAWAAFVILRFLYDYFFYPEMGIGSSEGIYIFPLLYPISGYALFTFVRRPAIAVFSFVLVSFLVTLYYFDLSAIREGHRALVTVQQNPIHAAAAQGMLVLCMLSFAGYLLRSDKMRPALRIGLFAISIVTLFIGLANVYALQSKGVWLALAVALPIQLLLIATMHSTRRGLLIMAGFTFVAVIVAVAIAWDGINAVAGSTAQAAVQLLSEIFGGAGLLQGVDHIIRDETLPLSFRERLMLWASAVLIWSKDPIFGQGVTWLHLWQNRAYDDAAYNLLHNGYLEIAIRYGLVGLAFYATLFSWAVKQVWNAKRAGLIDPASLHVYVGVLLFFCITILSNSNVRLAIGESYMWFAAAFAFYCFYLLQKNGLIKVRTCI